MQELRTCWPCRASAGAAAAVGRCGSGPPWGNCADRGAAVTTDSLLFAGGSSRGFFRAVAGDLPRMLRFSAARTARLRHADPYSSLPASPDVSSDIARPPDEAARPHEEGSAGGSGSRGRRAHCGACAAARQASMTREQPSQVCSSSGDAVLRQTNAGLPVI